MCQWIQTAVTIFEGILTPSRIRKAKDKGVKFGRKVKLTPEQLETFRREFENPPEGMTKTDIAKRYGLSRASGYRLKHTIQ